MFTHAFDVYFIDLNIIYHIFAKNWWYMLKILFMSYVMFYWVPTKIFPQEHTGQGIQKIVFNFIFMVAYVETVVTFLVFIKAFSLLLFMLVLIGTKLAFLKWYYKKNIILFLNNFRVNMMLWVLDFLDHRSKLKEKSLSYVKYKFIKFQQSLTFYSMLKNLLFFTVFFYIISTLMLRGLYSYSNPLPDTSQFIEWVNNLQHNILFSGNRISADFYGQAIIIFFVNVFTNIDLIILFSLYPILLLLAMYFSIFYIVKSFSNSKYVGIFAVMIHGIVLMSPLSDFILGSIIVTDKPPLIDFYGLKIYFPPINSLVGHIYKSGNVPYLRYTSGLAYEHASVFVLLNAYFLIKAIDTRLNKYLILYTLTLILVFTFHGGGAIILIIISILIAINAVIFRKIDIPILKKGFFCIIIAAIIGNLWILSMIKYGIPQDFGAAAPFLDKLLGTERNINDIAKMGTNNIAIITITRLHFTFFVMIFFSYIFSWFTKKKFINTSYVLIIIGIFIPYFGPNFGLPLVAKQSRLAEYMFFGITLLLAFYFFYLFCYPIFLLFKKYAKYFILFVSYVIFIIFILTVPRWVDTNFFWKSINQLEYTSISDIILKINSDNRPFDWTVVSYIQEYSKVRNKGYHVNTQNFLLKYNPSDKYLKIPTPKIYIFVENFPNPYEGKGEWYYRWRSEVQSGLKSWIAIYSVNHSNIRVYYKTKTVTVYEIDNSKYVNRLKKLNFQSKMERLKK